MKRIGHFLVYQPSTGYTMFAHQNIEEAVKEAKRLHDIHKKTFEILEIVGAVKEIEVPVVKKELSIELSERLYNKKDELPF